MKRLLLITALSLTAVSCEKIKNLGSQPAKLETQEDRTSYALGYVLSSNIKQSEPNLNGRAFLQGVHDSIQNKKPALTSKDIETISKQMAQKAVLKKQKEKGEKHKMEGQKFLEENKNKKGITVTESGLQYEALKEGKGKSPKETDTVEVHYRGTLIDGTEFDSSYKRNSSISFPLNGVIKGWTEGLQLMKEGAKYKFYIPPELAYGERGAGQSIPPHSTLIFEVELLKVQ